MNLHVGYLNIEGLRTDKHQACCSLIDAGLFDILFLSETWFPKSFNYMSHPYSFVHTPPGRNIERSRQSGGLLAMVSPRIQTRISSFAAHPDGILLCLDGVRMLAVYLPPSFDSDAVLSALSVFPEYDILFGDINVRFKNHTKSKRPSTSLLQDFWLDLLNQKSLSIGIPTREPLYITQRHKDIFDESHSQLLSSRFLPTVGEPYTCLSNCELDHLFHSNVVACPQLQLLSSKQFNLKTVHKYFLRFEIPIASEEASLRQGLGRFHLESLEKPGIKEMLAHMWNVLDVEIDWNIDDVDVYDSVLLNLLQAVSEEVLGTYDVLKRRKAPDKVQPFMHSQVSAVAAVQLFKRKQRAINHSVLIRPSDPSTTAMEECTNKFRSLFHSDTTAIPLPILTDDAMLYQELSSLVQSDRISTFVSRYPKDKACGFDSIHTILLQALSSTSFFSRLSGLYLLCIRKGRTPSRWNHSVMYLLPKTVESPITSDSVRPLSLLPMFRRIFESLILPSFTNDNKPYAQLHSTQAGFRKGYSTLTHAIVCHHALSTKQISYAVFLDFKSAYDVTQAAHVMDALRKRGLPPLLQHLVHSLMFRDGSFQLVVNNDLSSVQQRNRGLPQGSPLSPIIFNMFIDSLNSLLNKGPSRSIPRSLFFADDGLLLCKSLAEAVEQLNVAETWSRENGMCFNISKCGIVSPIVGSRELRLYGELIPIVSEYKYLGFIVDSNGIDFKSHLQRQVDTGTSFLKFLQVQCSEWSPFTRFVVYNTFLRPKLEYGAPLIHAFYHDRGRYDLLQKLQNESFAWIFNTNLRQFKVLEGILGMLSIPERFTQLRCSFQLHLSFSMATNPIRPLIESSSSLRCLRNDRMFTEFLSTPELPTTQQGMKDSLFRFLLSRRSGIISRSTSILVNYIPPRSRTTALVDKTLSAPTQYQRLLLSWRRGTLFLRRRCICGISWNRGHIKCLPKVDLSGELSELYDEMRQEHSKNFCEVDFLLNVGEWKMAQEVLKVWEQVFEVKEDSRQSG